MSNSEGGKSDFGLPVEVCSLCGIRQPLIRAHIYPKKLYSPITESPDDVARGDKVPYQYTRNTGQLQQWQSGYFDDSILCPGCDNGLFGPWDRYAQAFLAGLAGDGDIICVPEFDYHSLKLFFMSILWRSAATTLPFFASVKFGIWQEKLRAMLLAKDPGSFDDFSVNLVKYRGEFAAAMLPPEFQSVQEMQFYRFRVPDYTLLVKINSVGVSPDLLPFTIKPNNPLLIRVKHHELTEEYKRLLQFVLDGG